MSGDRPTVDLRGGPTRRAVLASAASIGAVLALPPPLAARPARRLVVATETIDVGGRAAEVLSIRDEAGRAGLVLDPGERFTVVVDNALAEPTIVHWHGQAPPPNQDGVAETGYVSALPPGANAVYDFAPRPGTHFMHSHHGLQEQRLMAAPLVVRDAADAAFDGDDVVMLLQDFSFRSPAAILSGLGGRMHATADGGAMPAMDKAAMPAMDHGGTDHGGMDHGGMDHGGMSHGAMDHGGTDASDLGDGGMAGMDHSGMAGTGDAGAGHGAMDHGAMDLGTAGPDLNDVVYDAFLANRRTLADPEVVRIERGGRVRLRIVNGAATSAFWVDFAGEAATVVAVDGNPVLPLAVTRLPVAVAQRVDVVLTVPAGAAVPVLAVREGERGRAGIVLAAPGASVAGIAETAEVAAPPVDLSLERRLVAARPLAARAAEITRRVVLGGGMRPYRWSIDGGFWPEITPIGVAAGARVALEIVNPTAMAHPMHLHGHHFQVVAIGGAAVAGAMRDTVLVPAGGSVTIAFDADNPGRWLFHCHTLYHMATGMMTEVVYG